VQLGLAEGVIRVRTFDMRSNGQLEVDTPNAALVVTGPSNFRVETYPDQNMSMLFVNNGEVQVSGSDVNQTVEGGQAVQLTGTNPVQVAMVALPGQDGFDQWAAQRDQRFVAAQTQQYVSPYVPGYDDLDAYGTWQTAPEYGAVWYPTGVVAGWAPYRYGRWAWVEPWGWTWVDTEPWGFAPFHYGRWVQIGPRWGWLPGPVNVYPVYGPAFVAFVGGNGFSVGLGGTVAWFPLGPGEPFYPWYHYSPGYLRQVNITNVRNINITNINITNINRVNYRYRTTAATAVSAQAFRSSQPVAHNLVRVNQQQLERAAIISHPEVQPAAQALRAGAPVTRPPVAAQRPRVEAMPARVAQPTSGRTTPQPARPNETRPPVADENRAPVANERPNQVRPPVATETRTPVASRTRAPMPAPPAQPPVRAFTPPQRQSRAAVASRPPEPQQMAPFSQREPAMQQHPGRPLEQRQNLRQAQPVGPMRDREVPSHVQAAPTRSAPASREPVSRNQRH
jgi:hypothetical protein